MNSIEIEVQTNDKDELFLQFPDTLMNRLGWQEGDELQFIDNKDGSFTVKKVKMTSIELDFSEEEYFKYLQAAHESNMSFNDWVGRAISAIVQDCKDEETA